MDKRRDKRGNIPVTILTIGVVLVCSLALYTFFSSKNYVRNSFVGIGVLEKMNSQIEKDYYYEQTGLIVGGYESINDIFNYARDNEVVKRKCNCGNDCDAYASMITDSSLENGISDPILLLSLMMQESECASKAFSGSSVGLMQINLIHCGEYGLPQNQEECKKQLLNDVELNIDVGAKILKASYDAYKNGKFFEGCSGKAITYYEWEAAIRGYNGWGCGQDASGNILYSQDNYVEEVITRYEKLREIGNYEDVIGKGGIWQLETTDEFPFVKRKDKFLFSAKFTETQGDSSVQ